MGSPPGSNPDLTSIYASLLDGYEWDELLSPINPEDTGETVELSPGSEGSTHPHTAHTQLPAIKHKPPKGPKQTNKGGRASH